MAKEAYYFSHDANSRNDPKILSMMLDYGIEGYGMFWIVVENLREQDGYKLKQDKSTWRALAMQLHKTVEEIKTFIEECINEYELFETDEVFFYSLSLLRRMNKKDEVTQKRKDAANARWNKNKDTNAMQVHNKSNTDAMQLDAKESKLNEKKVKEIYRTFKHLAISIDDYERLIKDGYSKIQIDNTLDDIENYAKNKNYTNLNLTVRKWLKKEDTTKKEPSFNRKFKTYGSD
jgi:hypothetical protein